MEEYGEKGWEEMNMLTQSNNRLCRYRRNVPVHHVQIIDIEEGRKRERARECVRGEKRTKHARQKYIPGVSQCWS
jgi:hypothetical protein